jgi:hypothetical protein
MRAIVSSAANAIRQFFSKQRKERRAVLLRAGLAMVFLFALTSGGAGHSQSTTIQGHSPIPRQDVETLSADDANPTSTQKRQLALNAQRQKQMVADASKLLKLAQELNDEVAASHPGAWAPEQLRKIAEIEKLARSVREKMIDGAGAPEPYPMAPIATFPVR